jgi:hypothetical protein
VRIDAASEPDSGSVSANDAISSPLASSGSQRSFCCGVPSIRMPWEPIPTVVPISERNAGAVWHSSIITSASSSIVRPRPPYDSGIVRPNRPIVFISRTMSAGMASVSATVSSAGTSRSRTKRRTLSSSAVRIS